MSKIIYGNAVEKPEAVSGVEYAVCYLDLRRGAFSNTSWREWFPSDTTEIFAGSTPITFFRPLIEFPYTTHYTVIAADGQVHEYADRAEAIEGFSTLPPQEAHAESDAQTVLPHFYYYHEVRFPSGDHRIGFFGSQS